MRMGDIFDKLQNENITTLTLRGKTLGFYDIRYKSVTKYYESKPLNTVLHLNPPIHSGTSLVFAKWEFEYIRIKRRSKLSGYELTGVDCNLNWRWEMNSVTSKV